MGRGTGREGEGGEERGGWRRGGEVEAGDAVEVEEGEEDGVPGEGSVDR